jgi:hypothetical protein
MKIAPAARLNPNEAVFDAQIDGSVKLFVQELKEIQPKYAVLLTNLSWAESFVKDLDAIILPKNKFIEWAGHYLNTLIVVTKRPYPNGPSDKYVDEILKLIRNH